MLLVQARQEVVEAADVAQVDLCVVRVSVVSMSSSLSIMRSHPHSELPRSKRTGPSGSIRRQLYRLKDEYVRMGRRPPRASATWSQSVARGSGRDSAGWESGRPLLWLVLVCGVRL